jgi:hypothetical protein
VSQRKAREDYGVVLVKGAMPDEYSVDAAGTAKLRAELGAARGKPGPMIDRGPGYERMARGECTPRMRKEA